MAEKKQYPTLRPRDAATLIIVRRRRGQPEILFGQRPGSHAFMPNRYVFPGGAVDRGDAQVRTATELRTEVTRRLMRACTPARARALAVAAVRETFEETGLVLGKPLPRGARAPRGKAWQGFARLGMAPALDELSYVFRAVTPPGRTRRFNARFFIADAEAISGEIRESEELDDVQWVPLAEAGDLRLPSITLDVLAHIGDLLTSGRPLKADHDVPVFKEAHGRYVRLKE